MTEFEQRTTEALTKLSIQHQEVVKQLVSIHSDLARLLDPETGIYSRVNDTNTRVVSLEAELRSIRAKVALIVGAIFSAITLAGNLIIRKLS